MFTEKQRMHFLIIHSPEFDFETTGRVFMRTWLSPSEGQDGGDHYGFSGESSEACIDQALEHIRMKQMLEAYEDYLYDLEQEYENSVARQLGNTY